MIATLSISLATIQLPLIDHNKSYVKFIVKYVNCFFIPLCGIATQKDLNGETIFNKINIVEHFDKIVSNDVK